MFFRIAGLLMACLLFLSSFLLAPLWAQDGDVRREAHDIQSRGASGAEYASQCWRHGVRCNLTYGDDAKRSPSQTNQSLSYNPQRPMVTGPWAIVVVLAILLLLIGLWMRFGNGGVLLASSPREMKKRQGEAPESWRASDVDRVEQPDQVLQRIAAMEDRRQALVQLLRHCLLQAADATGTRLYRSDTERTVLGRLPQDWPGRDRLENLLNETELVHYGGRNLVESQFADLLATARALLSKGMQTREPAANA